MTRSDKAFLITTVLLVGFLGLGCERSLSAAAPTIQWDESTRILVAEGAGYARMIRTSQGDILCVFDRGGRVWCNRSVDNGRRWIDPVQIARFEFGAATNPELLSLNNGWLLCSYNERPNDGVHKFAIATSISKDEGRTWSTGQRIYSADTKFKNGCWEPVAMQLPSGEIQLFFANENPYRSSGEQEITLLRSHDQGSNWSKPRKISFRAGHRDGMPVPLLLRNGRGIVVAIEDSGLRGTFKPAIIRTTMSVNWRSKHVDGRSRSRWSALTNPLAPGIYAGAPYIRQFPSGETVLSAQITEKPRRKPHMVVYVGNSNARNFSGRSVPFDVNSDTACLWNSLFIKDSETVTAVAGTHIGGRGGVWVIDGKLSRKAGTRRTAKRSSRRNNVKPKRNPGSGNKDIKIVAVWKHRVDKGAEQKHSFYSNGKINDPKGTATWSIEGRTLIMRWPSGQAPGGAWVDRCKLSANKRSYKGTNQNGNKITGTLAP